MKEDELMDAYCLRRSKELIEILPARYRVPRHICAIIEYEVFNRFGHWIIADKELDRISPGWADGLTEIK